ncbi:MAG: copper oxidase, partial [Phycisphaerae bacterium]
SGNRNQTVGDSIFHCHFYPHFAQGMWSLWRTHDVFEHGTVLDIDGRPVPGARALPDGEIVTGTPIPSIVPIPGLVMAPMPEADIDIVQVPGQPGGQVQINGAGNPGFPFFIPGVAGHRPPHPPMDTIHNGGLPRHVATGGHSFSIETRLDFTKELETLSALELPEGGTAEELTAMAFHAQRLHPSFTTDGTAGNYQLNGLPAAPGAPYADPCLDDVGNPVGSPRIYKAANIQLDAILNKSGWHFPQTRMIALWEDVGPTLDGTRPPEPLFFRANTDDCIEYHHTNLVPNMYEMDDFQVRTPTDILGQHIHLVKFDVTSSDGSGNGWNYEDGTFSPDEVRERIAAIRLQNACTPTDSRNGTFECPLAVSHPFFGGGPGGEWIGAQTTVQRWYADNVLNMAGEDRTLRTVFTHDHYGPSTHQQAGLYAGLLVEPKNSVWRHPETGVMMGSRGDGGPTGFRADILTADPADSYREFMLEFADFQLAYKAGNSGFPDPVNAINPPRGEGGGGPGAPCPGGVPPPCPEAISAIDIPVVGHFGHPGTMSVNYRNEPIGLRLLDPATQQQATGDAGDMSHVYRSITRADPALNVQPNFYPPLTGGVQGTDPFTPLLRAYENDKVQIRTLV